MIFGQRLESRYLCSNKSKSPLMIILEAPTRMLFIAKGNPATSHSMELCSLNYFLATFEVGTEVGSKVSMLP